MSKEAFASPSREGSEALSPSVLPLETFLKPLESSPAAVPANGTNRTSQLSSPEGKAQGNAKPAAANSGYPAASRPVALAHGAAARPAAPAAAVDAPLPQSPKKKVAGLIEQSPKSGRRSDIGLKLRPDVGPSRKVPPGMMTAEEARGELAKLRKEMRSIKNEESSLKWSLKREEVKAVVVEVKEERKDLAAWRQQQLDTIRMYASERQHAALLAELVQNKDFQEFKRSSKLVTKVENVQRSVEDYLYVKDFSMWLANKLRVDHSEMQRDRCAANLEKIQHMADVQIEDLMRERIETQEDRMLAEQLDLCMQLASAKQEREALIESTEQLKMQKMAQVPRGVVQLSSRR